MLKYFFNDFYWNFDILTGCELLESMRFYDLNRCPCAVFFPYHFNVYHVSAKCAIGLKEKESLDVNTRLR